MESWDRPIDTYIQGAALAMLRVLAAILGFGIAEWFGACLRWLIVTTLDAGESGPWAPIRWLAGFYWREPKGGTWINLFMLVALVVVALKAALLFWAIRQDGHEFTPVLMFAIGAAGLVASLFTLGMNMGMTMWIGARGAITDVAVVGVASNIGSLLDRVAIWGLSLVALLMVFLRALKISGVRLGSLVADSPALEDRNM